MNDATEATRAANRAARGPNWCFTNGERRSRAGILRIIDDSGPPGAASGILAFQSAVQSGQISVSGKRERLFELLEMLDTFPLQFPVVEPRPPVSSRY